MARSSPGDEHGPERPTNTTKPPVEPARHVDQPRVPEQPTNVLPPARQPKPFMVRAPAPVQQPITMVHHVPVYVPPIQEKPSKISTPEPSKTIPETIRKAPEKEFPEQFGNNSPNNSETIRNGNSLEPDKQAPQADSGGYKKKGKVGRQRKYEEPGNNGEIPVKKVVLFRHIKGRHWPGMSQDMQEWYDKYYFTKPKKTGKAADHARHLKSYERGQRWIAEHEGREYQPGTVGHSGKVLAYRKRATS